MSRKSFCQIKNGITTTTTITIPVPNVLESGHILHLPPPFRIEFGELTLYRPGGVHDYITSDHDHNHFCFSKLRKQAFIIWMIVLASACGILFPIAFDHRSSVTVANALSSVKTPKFRPDNYHLVSYYILGGVECRFVASFKIHIQE